MCIRYVDTALLATHVQYIRQVDTLPLPSTRRDRTEKYWNVQTVPFPSSIESRSNGRFLRVMYNVKEKVLACVCMIHSNKLREKKVQLCRN